MQKNELHNKRVFSFDLIRIIAVLAVVFIHSSGGLTAGYSPSSFTFIIENLIDSIARLGVPLFIMITGALMLKENKIVDKKTNFKYALKIFFLLYFWSFFYSSVNQLIGVVLVKQPFSFKQFFTVFIEGYYHLWYLYMLFSFALIMPILRAFVKKENSKLVLYFVLLSIVFQFSVPLLNLAVEQLTGVSNLITDYAARYKLDFIGEYTTYFLIGWYIANIEIKKKHRYILYIVGAVSFLTTVLSIQLLSERIPTIYDVVYSNLNVNILFSSIAVFVAIYYFFKDRNYEKYSAIATKLSSLTFGVYLLHPLFLMTICRMYNMQSALLQIFLNWLIATVGALALTYILSKTPYVKKLVVF